MRNDMTSTLKRRLEQLEENCWRRTVEGLARYLEGRSVADVEFFCANGYLPENPILGHIFEPSRMSWRERWKEWKEFQRVLKTKQPRKMSISASTASGLREAPTKPTRRTEVKI
jgi:hypothetical protein